MKSPSISSRFLISASLAVSFALFSSSADAVSSRRSSSWRQPSLMKRPLHKMGLGSSREQHDKVESNERIASSSLSSSPIENALFCVRGGGSNGPCIGIDLGKSSISCVFSLTMAAILYYCHIICLIHDNLCKHLPHSIIYDLIIILHISTAYQKTSQ